MKNPNRCRFIMIAIIIMGFIISTISGIIKGVEPLPPGFIAGAILSFGGILFGIITVRCPSCRSGLSLRGIGTEYCPHCGERID